MTATVPPPLLTKTIDKSEENSKESPKTLTAYPRVVFTINS